VVSTVRFAVEVAGAMLRPDRGATRHLPPGGTGVPGNHGSALAGREIAASIDRGELPRPRLTFVATGTAGSAAGVAAGAALAGHALDVVCVRVTQKPFGTTRRVAKAMRRLAGQARTGALQAEDRFYAPGYGKANAAGLEAARIAETDGLNLDQIYAAKAFASLVAHARAGAEGPLLFVHTSPGPPPGVN
jgi:1-aminocyclopropane-1-carboxylate deaminase/D-cysteine desulfhydrase-like pyridoxal-dependent ACC family enzyme